MPDPPSTPCAASVRRRRIAAALLAAALAAGALGQWHFGRAHAARREQWETFVHQRSLGLGWYAVMAAVAATLGWWTRAWPTLHCGGRGRRLVGLLLVLLIVAAGCLRFYRLHELPPGLWIDEALNGVQAVQIAQNGWPLVALPPEDLRTGLGAGFVDLAGLAFAWCDFDDGPWGIRAVAAVIGVVGVAAATALAWAWLGGVAALASGAWLTVSQWHLNYSRWGEMPLMASVVETLIALGVTVGLRARGWRAWAGWMFAGAMAGAGLYTYQSYRLFALLAPLVAAALAWRHRAALSGRWRLLAVAALVAFVVALPMLHYALTAPAQFGERAAETLLFGRADWRDQLAESLPRSLLAFQLVGDENPRHNLPFAPLLTPVPALLAALGCVLCVVGARRPTHLAILSWFAIALVPGVITLEAPHASRLLDAIVPLALMIGVAANAAVGVLYGVLPRPAALLTSVALALVAAGATARAEVRAYFDARERLPEFIDAFFAAESAPGRYLAAHAPDATVFLDPITYWHPATQFVAHRYLEALPNDVRQLRLAHDFPPRQPLTRDAVYLLPRPYASFAAVLTALSPRTACETWRDRFDRVDLVACRVPHDELNRAAASGWRPPYGLRGRFYPTADGSGAPQAEAALPFALCEYGLDEPPIGRFGLAVWDGTIEVPRDGEYSFRLNPDTTTLEIDGQRILSHAGSRATGGANQGQAVLRAGRWPIRITLAPGASGPAFLWFAWQPPGEEAGWVPATTLHPPDVSGDPPA